MAKRKPFRSSTVAVLGLLAATGVPASASAAGDGTLSDPDREVDTVTVPGSALSALAGRSIESFGLFRYDAATSTFAPIPFQVDERFLKTFNEGGPNQFSEMVYDVFDEDDGLFDADDEVAFLVGDAGPRAPVGGAWVDGADETRFEILVTDPRPGNPEPPRWTYLYTGPGLPRSATSYVSWDGSPTSSIETGAYRIDFAGNWLTTGLTVFAPCGSGTDLIDRFKTRVEPGGVSLRQDEEDWNETSIYLGGRVGPIRAIRYIRGARSAVNTILRDVVEPFFWSRDSNLRVHPVDAIWFYFDWLPQADATLFTTTQPGGLPVDGAPDAGVVPTFAPWHLMRSAAGGLFVSWNVPPSPLFSSRDFYYVDNSAYDDIVPGKSSYPDEDDSAYGSHGSRIRNTLDSTVNAIQLSFRVHPLCAGEGDLNLALTLQEMTTTPEIVTVLPQAGCGALRTVRASLQGPDLRLDWQPEPGANAYRVYVSASAALEPPEWTFAGETVAPTYIDPGGATGADRYYSVVCAVGGSEGPW